jgi:hypothetical protein
MIRRRRIVRSPIFEVAPSRCLPPVDLCKGVTPSQSAKSRLVLNVCTGGASAVIFRQLPELEVRERGASPSASERLVARPSSPESDPHPQHARRWSSFTCTNAGSPRGITACRTRSFARSSCAARQVHNNIGDGHG